MGCYFELNARRASWPSLLVDALGSAKGDSQSYLDSIVQGFDITASLVVDSTGSTVSNTGTSRGIGGPMDLALLKTLRRQAQIIYTSGKTARAEGEIRPKAKDLAVLSKNVSDETYGTGTGRVLRLGPNPEADYFAGSPVAGLRALEKLGYTNIHCEFGAAGTFELLDQKGLDVLLVSCEQGAGAQLFIKRHNLRISADFKVENLSVLLVTGRG